jgi:recombination protein RecR
MAFHVLKAETGEALRLARAIEDVKANVRHCSACFNLTDADPCPICADERRDRATLLVVEQPRDLIALEQTGMYKGLYHVLMGRISPLDGVGPGHLTIDHLLRRIGKPGANVGGAPIREVVLGLNPTIEGDGTALYIAEQLRPLGVRVTRLARGVPSGAQLEHANKAVLADAIQGRQAVE